MLYLYVHNYSNYTLVYISVACVWCVLMYLSSYVLCLL